MKHWFFIGIGGCGMAALAKTFIEKGECVSGSDLHESEAVLLLRQIGATVYIGHNAQHIDSRVDTVVVSSAIKEDNPELIKARELSIEILHRSDLLAMLSREKKSINIAGSHGKTTTSSMLATILMGLKAEPTCVVGGHMDLLNGNGMYGQGPWLVAEADESDGSFLKLSQYVSVITNIEDDHLDYYGSQDRLNEAFNQFVQNTDANGYKLFGTDCPSLAKLAGGIDGVVTFAVDKDADYQAKHIHYKTGRQFFEVWFKGRKMAETSIYMPGKYNVKNALAAFAAAHLLGFEPKDIAEALVNYQGVGRRYQFKGSIQSVTVIDDYAHHPTEIDALLKGASESGYGRVIALFQPHRYTRSKQFMKQFADVLTQADLAFVCDIYGAGEEKIDGISARLMVENAPTHVQYAGDLISMANRALEVASPNDLIITIGAGDVTNIGEMLLANLSMWGKALIKPRIVDLKAYNSWHVGGWASCFYDIVNYQSLIAVRPLLAQSLILGKGSNVLFDDGIYHQPILHVDESFSQVQFDRHCLVAEAGISLKTLADLARKKGLSGLEPYKYIPGSLGGAIYMNAGVANQSIMELVESVDVMYMDKNLTYDIEEIEWAYRQTMFMEMEHVLITSVRLRLSKLSVEEIERNESQAKDLRKNQPKGRSAGSTFKNPPGHSAGALIDGCGLKGVRIGDAQIAEKHANFILNLGQATSQDIHELIELCKNEVEKKHGVLLETEVECFSK